MATTKIRKLSLTPSPSGYLSAQFSSTYAEVFLDICAIAHNASPQYRLFGYDENGTETLLFEKTLNAKSDGSFSYVHSFDPVSMAVYQNAATFRAQITDAEDVTLTLTEHEQSATESALSSRKIRGPRPLGHVLFVGNSLLLGIEGRYGMCSSAHDKDYFHLTCEAIRKSNPNCKFSRVHGSPIEHCENVADFEDILYRQPNIHTKRPFADSLTPDLDLIVLQITDNVNTEKKEETFHHTAETLLRRIREHCPHAEILWVYGWYYKRHVMPRLLELCEQYDVEPVDLRPVRFRANEAYSGMLYESADGSKKVANDLWITHPGDSGMRAIAERIVDVLRETLIL